MKFCAKCGSKIIENQKFCAKCGSHINNLKTTTPEGNVSTNPINNNASTNPVNNNNNVNNKANSNLINNNANSNSVNNSKFNNNPKVNSNNINNSRNNMLNTNKPNNYSIGNNTSLSPRKPINKLMILIPTLILMILIVSVLGIKSYFTKKYSPKNVISEFQSAILTKDADSLKDILFSLNDTLDIDESDSKAIIKYLSENSSELNNVVTNLNNDYMLADNLTVEGSPLLLDDSELFALTITSKNFLFNKYAVMVRPLYFDVYSNNLPAKIFIGDDEKSIISSDDSSVEVGPIAPGDYDITLKTTDIFGKELSETLSTNPIDILDEYSLDFFTNYSFSEIYTNVPEASIFLNGKDTGKTAKDYENASFGPLSEDDAIQLVYTINDDTYKTEEIYYNDYYSYIDLSFYYSDYEKIQLAASGLTNTAAAEFISEYSSTDYIIPTSDTVLLDFKSLNDYTAEELFIARNEMFARYGYVFKTSPNLQAYFESKSWYTPDENYSGDLDTEVEQSNVGMIKSIEFLKMAYDSCQYIWSDYVFPDSDTEVLSASEVSELNDWELIVARNEIFARYGLNFSTKELVDHFTSKSWFSINSSIGNDVPLNSVENKNIATIVAEENKRISEAVNHDLGE